MPRDIGVHGHSRKIPLAMNEYFRLLLEERWVVKKSHNGKPWKGPMQYEDETGQLMMLPSDMALIQDPTFKKYVELYANDEGR